MLDFSHIPTQYGAAEVLYLEGSSPNAGAVWVPWTKPRGKSMIDILLVGKGGDGGVGAIGANSTAAGGGGGGSGGHTRLTMPLHILPDRLYISLAGMGTTTTMASYITISPKMTAGAGAPAANDVLMIANGGGNGGNAAGATAGAAGAAGGAGTAATMPLGWIYATTLIGQAGIIGGVAVAGGNITLPLTGLFVTGGAAGAGLPAAAAVGTVGGTIGGGGVFLGCTNSGSAGTATTPPNSGMNGYRQIPNLLFGYGGSGGGSTHGSATGAGLVQSSGGIGAPGSGGGGGGGALTGSTAGVGGMGGPAFCVITCW